MEENYTNRLRDLGIDLDKTEHPFSEEYSVIVKTGDPFLIKCIEHLLLMLIFDLETIRRHSEDDYVHYTKRLRASNSSFWGHRFEISFYSSLIFRFKNKPSNLRRGKEGHEADFVFDYNGSPLSIEATSVVYELNSNMTNPTSKIKGTLGRKEKLSYASTDCCLVIDYTNLSFYRKILSNFSTSISKLIEQIDCKFGVVLFHEAFHSGELENPKYFVELYDWQNKNVNKNLNLFLADNLSQSKTKGIKKVHFRI